MMQGSQVNNEYLQGLGVGLQALRASGQFCDAMVCVGSTRILVHKVVLSAASKALHDLALDFDMMPHGETDQLKIIIPADVSLFAVNMFVNFLYTGQLELNSRIVGHMERLGTLFGVSHLIQQCQAFIQRSTTPDSQNLNLRTVNQTEADSSLNGAQPIGSQHRLSGTPDISSHYSELSRSNSACSGLSADAGLSFNLASVKTEPAHLASYEETANRPASARGGVAGIHSSPSHAGQSKSMSALEKLMSPVVNLKKLPANITPDTVVLVSDDDHSDTEGAMDTGHDYTTAGKPLHHFTLEEKETIAIEAKRYGTTRASTLHNVPLPDILSWMTLFGLRNLGNQRSEKRGKQADHAADLALVRWIVQQQEMQGCVDLNNMKQYALTVHKQNNPKFCASKTWLGNFLQRNMSVLQGTKFVNGDKCETNMYGNMDDDIDGSITVKQEVFTEMEGDNDSLMHANVLENLGQSAVLEDVPMNEQTMLNEAIMAGFNNADDYDEDNDDGFADSCSNTDPASNLNSYVANETFNILNATSLADKPTTHGSFETPFGKRPIIVGQSKSLDAKSERKIVQWVLEKQKADGFVFTDDFKNFAKTLYKGDKPFGATQCWMKKFLRRNRALKDVKFCSKFKNTYTSQEKLMAVTMAKRYGVGYAAKQTGINSKAIHHWKLSADKGLLNLDTGDQHVLNAMEVEVPEVLRSSPVTSGVESPSTSAASPVPDTRSSASKSQASHGIVPAFEDEIVKQIKQLQAEEGSVNYNDISKISQSIYKETRPTFKASYSWIRTFMERNAEGLVGIELENVSKVIVPEDPNESISSSKITAMVDKALEAIGTDSTEKSARPLVIGPSVMFDRKTEKRLVEWAVQKQQESGYVFTDDFKVYAKSLHTGPKHFSASSGWMTLFLRRHRALKDVKWKSKFKSSYTEEEKRAAVMEAKRLGTGHVARQLNIDSSLLCAWRIKMERSMPKQQSFWKGTKIKKFGKNQPKFAPASSSTPNANEACRGIVPEFENRIISLIHEEHQKEGSISYEEMSRIAQSVYKETRPSFKASYAWIRNFMKRNEHQLTELNIDNVKKVFMPEDEGEEGGEGQGTLNSLFQQRRPIIVGQSRSLDTKTEKKLVQWVVEQQETNGYVFLDQFKAFAKSLYKGHKKFAATQAWRIKFLRRNHTALKNVKFTSSFRNQYTLEEKTVIVQEARKFGAAHVSKKTGIDHCLINQWRLKLEREGVIPVDEDTEGAFSGAGRSSMKKSMVAAKLKSIEDKVGPGLYSSRGIVPAIEKKICQMVMNKMDEEGSVTYQDVSRISRAVFRQSRPNFKASYNWIVSFLKRNKKDLRHVEWDTSNKTHVGGGNLDLDVEVLIPEDELGDVESYMESETDNTAEEKSRDSRSSTREESMETDEQPWKDPMIVIDNPEDPNYEAHHSMAESNSNLARISKKPIIIGKARHFTRKEERKIVEWLVETQATEGFVFTDDLRRFARQMYHGEPGKFGATQAWIQKFLRRNKLENKIEFQSRLIGNNPKYELRIVELILEQQEKEGSVSNDDIQKITMSVYKEIRPNFRACYNWIKGFIKRHSAKLVSVDLENVKKVYIPDDNEKDGVLIRDYDPSMPLLNSYMEANRQGATAAGASFTEGISPNNSWLDMDSSVEQGMSSSFNMSSSSQSHSSVLDRLSNQKRPIIIAPPKGLDVKTEKKLVQWMIEQQKEQGCVYLDLFKQYAKSIHTGPKHFAATQAWMIRFKQRNRDALRAITIKSRFRNEYSHEEKVACVEEAKRLGCNHVGRKLGINGGVIYSWKVQLENAEKQGTEASFSEPADNKELDSSRGVVPEFETAIVNMILETQRAKASVTYDDISMCARSVYKETRPNFKASYNWVMDFIRKYKDQLLDVTFENQKKTRTEEEKLRILSEEKKYGTEHVVKKRNISSSTLYHWRRQFQAKSVPIPKFKAIVSSKIKKKYAQKQLKAYTMEEKRNMVSVAEENGITHATLKLGISRGVLTKWIRYFRDMGEQININPLPSGTVKKELEQKVLAWVLEQHQQLGIVLTHRVQEHAKKVFEEAFTNFTATTSWLEGFLAQNGDKFENVRFRDKEDRDLEFSDEVKLKVARHAEKVGAVATAEMIGLLPKVIYKWRKLMKTKGHDLAEDTPIPATVVKTEASSESTPEPKSLMQQKLDKIADKFDEKAREDIVTEASIHGTSAVASKYKIPLPLILKWMKVYVGQSSSPVRSHSRSASVSSEGTNDGNHDKLRIKLPGFEKSSTKTFPRHSKSNKQSIVEEAKKLGVKETGKKYGVGFSTLYGWLKDERESSVESRGESVERSVTSPSPARELPAPRATIAARDIKKEPGTTSTSTAPQCPPTTQQGKKIPRRYSDEQKIEVAKNALLMGVRKTSQQMSIPHTNVVRWVELYKHKFPHLKAHNNTATSPKGSSASSPASSPVTSSMSKSPVRNLLTQPLSTLNASLGENSSSADKKRKADKTSPIPGSLGYKRVKYTDEQRIGFVKLSESENTICAANAAGVSIDVLYKWRSKYLPEIRLAEATGHEDDNDEADDDGDNVSTHTMPAPRNRQFDIAERFMKHAENKVSSTAPSTSPDTHSTSKDMHTFHGTDSDGTHTGVDDESSDIGDMQFKMAGVNDYMEMPDDSAAHVESIDDNDIIAADHILELMNSNVQNTNTQGATCGDKTNTNDSEVNNGEHAIEQETLDQHVTNESDVTHESEQETTSVSEHEDTGHEWNMLKIVNVKSEAAMP